MDPNTGNGRPKRSAVLPARLQCAGESGAAAGLGLARAPPRLQSPAPGETTPPSSPSSLALSSPDPEEIARLHQALKDKDPVMKALLAKVKASRVPHPPDEVGNEDEEDADMTGSTSPVDLASGKDNSPNEGILEKISRGGSAANESQDNSCSDGSSDEEARSAASPCSSLSASIGVAASSSDKRKRHGGGGGQREEGSETGSAARGKRRVPKAPEQPAPRLPYVQWTLTLLRKVVLFRGISGHQKKSDRTFFSRLLTRQDADLKRTTPYTGDFIQKATSSSQVRPPACIAGEGIPEGALMGFEHVMKTGISRSRDYVVNFQGGQYLAGDITDALKERRGISSGTDGQLSELLVSGNTRKTKSCCLRLINILASDAIIDRFVQSEQQASRSELDTGSVGAKRSIWLEIQKLFVDPATKVDHKLSGDVQFMHLDTSVCNQPTISPGKLMDMYNDTRKKLNTCTVSYKKSGMGAPFWDFCGGDTDVLYLHDVCQIHTSLQEFTQTLLPENARAEAGFGGAGSPEPPSRDERSDGDDDDEEGRKSNSVANKLGEAAKAKRAGARRKKAAQTSVDTYLPLLQTAMGSGSTGGQPAGGGEVDEGRAQAALVFDRARAKDKVEESGLIAQQAQQTRYEMYKTSRKRIRDEKDQDDPDEPFIKLLEQDLKVLLEDIAKHSGV